MEVCAWACSIVDSLPLFSVSFIRIALLNTSEHRPPELLLGSRVYGPAVDVWSMGCIMGEVRGPGREELTIFHFLELCCRSSV